MVAFSPVCRIIFPFVIQMTQRRREKQKNHKLQSQLLRRSPELTTNVGEEDNHKSKLLTSCFRPISWRQPQKEPLARVHAGIAIGSREHRKSPKRRSSKRFIVRAKKMTPFLMEIFFPLAAMLLHVPFVKPPQ